MVPNTAIKLPTLSFPAKILCSCYIVTLLIGYGVSLLQVYDRSHFNLERTATYYRGDPTNNEELLLPQTYTTILSVTHTHTLSQPLMMALLGFIFLFSGVSSKTKSFLIISVFTGIILSNLAPWMIRYISATTVYLFPISQLMIALGIFTMSFRSIYELWIKK